MLGPDHPAVAAVLNNIASGLFKKGKLAEAEPLLRRSLSILEVALGRDDPRLARIYESLSILQLADGSENSAITGLRQSVRILDVSLRTSSTEDYAAGLIRTGQDTRHVIYGLPLVLAQLPDAVDLAMRTALLNQSRTIEIGMLASRALQSNLKTPEQKARYQRMQDLLGQRANLLKQSTKNPGNLGEDQKLLWDAQQIEQALTHEVGVGSSQGLPRMDEILERVAARLPPEGALVQVVIGATTNYSHVQDLLTNLVPHYVALLLLPNRDVQAIDLGSFEQVHPKVQAWLGELAAEPPNPKYIEQTAQAYARQLSKSQAAYAQLFRPIDEVLKHKRVRHVVVAPDGVLNAVPWGALHDGTQYLVDRFQIQYVSAGRDLLSTRALNPTHGALVLAATDAPDQRPLEQARKAGPVLARELHGKLLGGQAATEQNLRQRESPYALTLISHGVFQDGTFVNKGMSVRPRRTRRSGQSLSFESIADEFPLMKLDEQWEWDAEDAMQRSALALMPGKQAQTDSRQDGWLTGAEVRELNLRGTQLVTVLACQSGKGGLSLGQGVYGLRRAFLQAGAETVVSTLWSVDEPSATELVKQYIHKLINTPDQERIAAMEEAMKEMRNQPKYKHPYYWAPFVVMGMDGPLRPPTTDL